MYKYALCELSVVPVRKEANERSEMVTQMLFGEMASIIKVEEKWLYIELLHDNYKGWVDRKMLKPISTQEYSTFKTSPSIRLSELFAKVTTKNGTHIVSMGSIIRKVLVVNYIELQLQNQQPSILDITRLAQRFLNTPYLWGGRTFFGIDCSGFIQTLFTLVGIDIPRDASQQIALGSEIETIAKALPGDLAFFGDGDKITHVGLVLENEQIIHASGCVRIDSLDPKGIYNTEVNDYTHSLRIIKRLI